MKEGKQITDNDFDIIASMFGLHKTLNAIETVLFNQGFILSENKKDLNSQDATWIYEKEKEIPRTVKYSMFMHETMWNRSDKYGIDIDYTAGDVKANYQHRDLEMEYGSIKECYRIYLIKIKDKMILENKIDY